MFVLGCPTPQRLAAGGDRGNQFAAGKFGSEHAEVYPRLELNPQLHIRMPMRRPLRRQSIPQSSKLPGPRR